MPFTLLSTAKPLIQSLLNLGLIQRGQVTTRGVTTTIPLYVRRGVTAAEFLEGFDQSTLGEKREELKLLESLVSSDADGRLVLTVNWMDEFTASVFQGWIVQPSNDRARFPGFPQDTSLRG